jgi:hypothetical protein
MQRLQWKFGKDVRRLLESHYNNAAEPMSLLHSLINRYILGLDFSVVRSNLNKFTVAH